MKSFWVSWYHRYSYGAFELNSPWWISGFGPASDSHTVCAAVRAHRVTQAIGKVIDAYDTLPINLKIRFCEQKEKGWSPFCDRFPKADWMEW
jgi:hypothetical protein